MKIREFDVNDYSAIVHIHNRLNVSWPERPRTSDGWKQAEEYRNPKSIFQRWVAEVNGEVVGFGQYGQSHFKTHPHRFHINIEVSPAHQRQGIGTSLYDQIMTSMSDHDPHTLRADAFTNLPDGFSFLQKRGFYEAFRETPVRIDITSFDSSPYKEVEKNLANKNIYIKTLREMESDPDRNRKLYELYWDVSEDVPHEDTDIIKPEYEDWLVWGVNDPIILPDAYFIAVCGNQYVGLRELGKDPDNNVLMGGLLGVHREYRKLGIALAMQLRGIAYAKKHGYPELKSCTAIHNAPMQALFTKLGYKRGPEWIQCQKDL